MTTYHDIPAMFETEVYRRHSEAIIAAVHEVFPAEEEHDGRLCDAICDSVGRMVAGLLYDHSREPTAPPPDPTPPPEKRDPAAVAARGGVRETEEIEHG